MDWRLDALIHVDLAMQLERMMDQRIQDRKPFVVLTKMKMARNVI